MTRTMGTNNVVSLSNLPDYAVNGFLAGIYKIMTLLRIRDDACFRIFSSQSSMLRSNKFSN